MATGQPASLRAGRRVSASAGAIALTGNAASFTYARRFSASVGIFALTGKHAFLHKPFNIIDPSYSSLPITSTAAPLDIAAGYNGLNIDPTIP